MQSQGMHGHEHCVAHPHCHVASTIFVNQESCTRNKRHQDIRGSTDHTFSTQASFMCSCKARKQDKQQVKSTFNREASMVKNIRHLVNLSHYASVSTESGLDETDTKEGN